MAPGHDEGAHDRPRLRPLRRGVQPAGALRHGDARGLLGDAHRARRRSRSALGETSPTAMYIHLSQTAVPAGQGELRHHQRGQGEARVRGAADHRSPPTLPDRELRGRGQPDRRGRQGRRSNVGETGDMAPGHDEVLTIDLASGHYAVVCNLAGHYAMGMHQDLWVTPPGSVPVTVGARRDRVPPRCTSTCPRPRRPGQGELRHHQRGQGEARVRGAADQDRRRQLPDRELRRRGQPHQRGRQGDVINVGRPATWSPGHRRRCSRSTSPPATTPWCATCPGTTPWGCTRTSG